MAKSKRGLGGLAGISASAERSRKGDRFSAGAKGDAERVQGIRYEAPRGAAAEVPEAEGVDQRIVGAYPRQTGR